MEVTSVSRYSKTRAELKEFLVDYPEFSHESLQYWCSDYELLRDTFNGERDMKQKTRDYLPQPSGMDDKEYAAYLDRSSYFNMTGRTVSALVGTLFKRAPIINNWPKRFDEALRRMSKQSTSLMSFMKETAQEQFAVGRYGVLVDMETSRTASVEPYFTGYVAENIIDWESTTYEGRERLSSVILREKRTEKEFGKARVHYVTYRHLHLVFNPASGKNEYVQDHYVGVDGDATLDRTSDLVTRYVPKKRGTPFNKIPFVFFGPFTTKSDIEKPPVLDIARLNVSHYQSSAQLEHGRFYTGNPIYYVQTDGSQEQGSYTIGASVVWEVGTSERPGIIEFNGQGLKFLENAQREKEAMVSSLGGRMIGIQTQSVSESDNQVSMKEKNERTLLLNVSNVLDDGFTELLAVWLNWMEASVKEQEAVSVETNKDFLLENIGARELRAVQSLYAAGLIDITVLYNTLRAAEIIPDHMQMDEFRKTLEDPKNFPNQPDADARDRGFPDRKTELELEAAEKAADQAKDLQMNADAQALRQQEQVVTEKPKPDAENKPEKKPKEGKQKK